MVIYLLMNYEHIFIHSCKITYLSFGLSSRRGVLFQHHWNFFLWKRGFSTGTKCMETISLRQANKRPLLLKDKYSMSATKLQRQQRGQNVLIFFF